MSDHRTTAALLLSCALLGVGCGSGDDGGSDAVRSDRAVGITVQGTGYSLKAPVGWTDRTREASQNTSIKPDRLIAAAPRDGFATNVNVVFEPAPDADLTEIGNAFKQQLKGIGATDVTTVAESELSGEESVTYTYVLDEGGAERRARQVVAAHGGRLYTISFTAAAAGFEEGEARFDEILSSWTWT